MEKKKDTINRREFLKRLGLGGLTATAALYGCQSPRERQATSAGFHLDGDMTLRTHPESGDQVSLLGYGCMRWPKLETPDADGNVIDQEAVNELVDYAIEHGVNYFDTAPVYMEGFSERSIGLALKRHPRKKFFIATKMSNFSNADFENSVAIYRKSFKELQVDYIDYYLLHSVSKGVENYRRRFIDNGVIDFLLKEREAGRIRHLGLSFHGDPELFEQVLADHEKYHWDFVQIQMNWLDWRHAGEVNRRNSNAEYLYTELARRNIPVVIMEPLLGGRLSKVHDHIVTLLKQRDPERSVASWAFRFAGTYPKVLTVLSGMTYKEHLQDNLMSYSPLTPLSEDDLAFLEHTAEVMLHYPTIPCNDCKYCMPCPYGLDIPAILLHYNRCVNEDRIATSEQDPNYRSARRAFLIGYDRAVPRERQADRCVGCGRCIPECPQSIDIPKEMQRIDQYVEGLKRSVEC